MKTTNEAQQAHTAAQEIVRALEKRLAVAVEQVEQMKAAGERYAQLPAAKLCANDMLNEEKRIRNLAAQETLCARLAEELLPARAASAATSRALALAKLDETHDTAREVAMKLEEEITAVAEHIAPMLDTLRTHAADMTALRDAAVAGLAAADAARVVVPPLLLAEIDTDGDAVTMVMDAASAIIDQRAEDDWAARRAAEAAECEREEERYADRARRRARAKVAFWASLTPQQINSLSEGARWKLAPDYAGEVTHLQGDALTAVDEEIAALADPVSDALAAPAVETEQEEARRFNAVQAMRAADAAEAANHDPEPFGGAFRDR